MSTYHEEHNINEKQNVQKTDHVTLAQQMSDFLSNPERSSAPSDISQLEQALRQFEDSPLAQQLAQRLQESESNNDPSQGMPQSYIDSLDRIPKKKFKKDDTCAICTSRYLDDQYPLVVKLPCNDKHHFDLECIGPWLKFNHTCPMCRKDLLEKKEEIIEDSEEEYDDFYA